MCPRSFSCLLLAAPPYSGCWLWTGMSTMAMAYRSPLFASRSVRFYVADNPPCLPQNVFEDDKDVLYISLHRFGRGFYPGSGHCTEVGTGDGKGYTVNIPWHRPGIGDTEYMAVCARPALDSVTVCCATVFVAVVCVCR